MSEHRAGLRLKRLAVKSRIRLELQESQLEHMQLQLQRAKTVARIQGLQTGLQARTRRAQLVADHLQKRGERDGKERALKEVAGVIPRGETAGSRAAAEIANRVLRESFERVEGGGDVRVDVAVGMVRELGLGREEVEGLLREVEGEGEGEGGGGELRELVMGALEEEEEEGGKGREGKREDR